MITVTENAIKKVETLLIEENDPSLKLRMFVQGGGCSGFQYGFTFDTEKNDDDFEIPLGSTIMLVDAMSMQYVQGAEVDFVESLNGSQFNIKNPNAQTTCGCGSSFSA
jgi:iron-sulfur cluster insertion protein